MTLSTTLVRFGGQLLFWNPYEVSIDTEEYPQRVHLRRLCLLHGCVVIEASARVLC